MTTTYSFPIEINSLARWVVEFDYSPGRPGCHTQRNGDPGWPDEPEEFNITDMRLETRNAPATSWEKTEISLDESLTNLDYIQHLCEAFIDHEHDSNQAEQCELSRD